MNILPPPVQKKHIPHGTRVLVRSSLNVPMVNGEVAGTFRLRETLRTIEFLRKRSARITVVGHLGRVGASLGPVHRILNRTIPVSFIPKVVGDEVYAARAALRPGEVLLLENTRTDPREAKNDIIFAEELGLNAEMFVFDDFSAAHRSETSTTGLIRALPSYAGIRFYQELTALLRITERVTKPAVAIVGGAKCKTKVPLIKEMLKTYDTVFVAGVIANTLLKQKGYNVGASVTEKVSLPKEIMESTNIIFPREVMVTKDFFKTRAVPIGFVEKDDVIVDVGNGFLKIIQYHLENAKTVMCNGPLGWYEKGFSEQTAKLSALVKKAHAYSFIGGGDTVALLEQQNLMDSWGFVSTGGGSLLAYFSSEPLAVLKAFEEKRNAAGGKAQ